MSKKKVKLHESLLTGEDIYVLCPNMGGSLAMVSVVVEGARSKLILLKKSNISEDYREVPADSITPRLPKAVKTEFKAFKTLFEDAFPNPVDEWIIEFIAGGDLKEILKYTLFVETLESLYDIDTTTVEPYNSPIHKHVKTGELCVTYGTWGSGHKHMMAALLIEDQLDPWAVLSKYTVPVLASDLVLETPKYEKGILNPDEPQFDRRKGWRELLVLTATLNCLTSEEPWFKDVLQYGYRNAIKKYFVEKTKAVP